MEGGEERDVEGGEERKREVKRGGWGDEERRERMEVCICIITQLLPLHR